jgi:H+/Cl- antiporter ClcA
MSGPRALRLIGIGAVVGIPAAVVAALFQAAVHELQHWLWNDVPDWFGASSPPWFLVLGLPLLGAALVLAARKALPGPGGHEPLEGITVEQTPVSYAPGVALAALASLPFGAVLGPEAPLIALGSAVGVAIAGFGSLEEQEVKVVSLAGSFSAISALFGGPLVAGLLLLEASIGLGMGAATVRILVPGLVAASLGYLIFVGFGDWGGLGTPGLTVPNLPGYEGVHALDIVVALVLGVVIAVLIEAVQRGGAAVAGPGRERLGPGPLLLLGGLAVGALALAADGLGADSQEVLFSGQQPIPDVLTEGSIGIIIVVIAAKAIAYAVSLGCGFRGGPVFPSIFLGVACVTVAMVAFDLSPTLAVGVGTAAGTAAITRLLFAPILFAALLVGTGGADVIPVAALAAVASWLVTATIHRPFAKGDGGGAAVSSPT